MNGEEEKKSSKVSAAKTLSIILGLVLLFIVFSNSGIIVSDTYTPAINRQPTSLVCEFVGLDFSTQIIVSNITGERFTLLTVEMGPVIKKYVIPYSSMPAIKGVGLLEWRDGEMLGILPSILSNRSYTIERGYTTRFGRLGTEEKTEFLIVESLHTTTGIEQAIINYSDLSLSILLLLLSTAFSLVLVPLFEALRPLFAEEME